MPVALCKHLPATRGRIAAEQAGVVKGLAIADGVASLVLQRPLLGHAGELGIVRYIEAEWGVLSIGECNGTG